MKALRSIIIIAVIQVSLSSCENGLLSTESIEEEAISISLSGESLEKAIYISLSGESSVESYPLGSACLQEPNVVSTNYWLSIFKDTYTSYPDNIETVPMVVISGSTHTRYMYLPHDAFGVDWTPYFSELNDPENIKQIRINNLDESLGLGNYLEITMKDGKYDGGNEKIKDVRLNSYTIWANLDSTICDIDVDIFLADSGFVAIRCTNEPILLRTGYY